MNGRSLLVTAALVLSPASASAEGWNVGSNFGFSLLKPKGGGDDLIVLGAPGSVGQFIPAFQPGLRIGVPVGAGENEIYFDTGLSVINTEGETLTGYEVTVNFQHDFKAEGPASPYITVGGGIMGQHFAGESNSNTLIGAGLGGLTRVRGGHGAVRFEVRYDHVSEDTQGFVGGNLIGLKFGFDLWLR